MKLTAILFILLSIGCSENQTEKVEEQKSAPTSKGAVSSDVVARVDGVEISGAQVKELIDSVDGGLTTEQAIHFLIDNELLAGEARKRGFSTDKEVTDAEKIELARALLKTRIKKGITAGDVDEGRLKDLYENNKERFVHGVMRKVNHVLVHTGNNGMPDEEAEALANEIAQKATKVATAEEFDDLCQPFKDQYPKKVRIESLQPFSADNKRFVSEFVKAAFSIPGVGQASKPFKTKFGWHVIFFVGEFPAENRSFEDAKNDLAEKILPTEKKNRFLKLLEDLENREGIFLHQDAINNREPPQ